MAQNLSTKIFYQMEDCSPSDSDEVPVLPAV
eukprot:CAMPEP_0168295178 /NCGR_PEP_ID=MMETSP0142_2-20121227/10839_1 /TAXON_ID=44445 /ORGANISM="Pseudo-nitzschia australis, Strain 10249 10 AB" /LENGTH=30 /DNA_ID= /DNA_START= /DNA_END= /DNA_ORIENTATION=